MNRLPTPFRRFLILMKLRQQLWVRTATQNPARLFGLVLSLLIFLVLGVMAGVAFFRMVQQDPAGAASIVHGACLAVFIAQVALGLVTLVVSEFFDVSRLLHFPLGYREVFAAMVVSGLITPMALLYAAPLVGASWALGGGVLAVVGRLLAVTALLLFGHAVAILLNLVFLTLFSRRRLRDLATIASSLVGMTFYVGWRFLRGDGGQVLSDAIPVHVLRWTPPGWMAEAMVGTSALGVRALGLGAFAAVLSGVLLLGAKTLRRSFLGEQAGPGDRELMDRPEGGTLLPGDVAAVARASRRVWSREPQIRALWIQQTAFLLVPAVLTQVDHGGQRPEFTQLTLLILIATALPFSHIHFASSLFGLDGRGITLLLLSPLKRTRLLWGKGIALFSFFLMSDVIVVTFVLAVVGLASGIRSGSPLLPATLQHGTLVPFVWVSVVLTDMALMAMGTVFSVLFPYRIATAGRRPIHGQRTENAGCVSQLLRALLYIPALGASAVLGVVALWPFRARLLPIWDVPPEWDFAPRWGFVSIPGAFLLALGAWFLAVQVAARLLASRETQMARALGDTGE